MSNHTPGPWKEKQKSTYSEPGYVVLWPDKGGEHMRRLDYQGCFTEADARLIAAAPELLDALKAIVSSLSEHDEEGLIEHVEPMRKARAAIAKAEGVE